MSFAFLPKPRAARHSPQWTTSNIGAVTVIGFDSEADEDAGQWMVLDAERRVKWIGAEELVFDLHGDDPVTP